MKRLWLLAGIAALLPVAAAAAPLKVVASFSILADMAQQIAGDRAAVIALVGPDGDAHTFDPSPADAAKLAGAAVVIVNGLGLDGWMERLATAADYRGPVVTVSTGITLRRMAAEGGASATIADPHAWQDLKNGILYVRAITAALAAADPAGSAAFKTNADRYVAELAALDESLHEQFSALPEAKRHVITSHDAFGYFGAAYGITFQAPEGISTDTEPSAAGVAHLIDQIRALKVKAIFIENMTDPRLIAAIAGETGTTPGGKLYSDALSAPDGPAATYAAMFRSNAKVLLEGLARN